MVTEALGHADWRNTILVATDGLGNAGACTRTAWWLPSACLVDFGQRCDGARRGRRTRPAPLLHLSEAQAVASIAISTVEVTTWDVVLPAGSIAATLPVKVRLGNDSRAEPVARQSHRS